MNVAVVGASNKENRYSYKAVMLLQDKGHRVYPVHHRIKMIEEMSVYPTLKAIQDPIDTITLYVSADVSSSMEEDILGKKPLRIIFNPGAENDRLEQKAQKAGIQTLKACTLVLLHTGQF